MSWLYPLSDILVGREEEEAVLRVVRSKWLSMGPEVAKLESELGERLSTPHALAVNNCTAALHLALLALDIGPGDEVIVPSLTFVATANAVLYTGAVPVFADVQSVSRPLLDSKAIARAITSRTKAVIVMHYAGYPCDMDEIMRVARDKKIRVIEDSAHAAFSSFLGRACGTWGDIGCLSFFGNKNLPCGEGGAIVCADKTLADKIKMLRSHGMTTLSWDKSKGHASEYDVVGTGYNYRMPELSAALARVQLQKLSAHNKKRDETFATYVSSLKGTAGLLIPFQNDTAPGARHLMTVLLDDAETRKKIVECLKEKGIQTSIHYKPVHLFSSLSKHAHLDGSLDTTLEYSRRTLSLPFHPGLDRQAVLFISDVLKEALSSA